MGTVIYPKEYHAKQPDNGTAKSSHKDQIRDLLKRLSDEFTVQHLALSTRRSYTNYVKEYVYRRERIHATTTGEDAIREYLTYLAVEKRVSASTQNVALNALLFLYKHVLKIDVGLIDAPRAHSHRKIPAVFTREEVTALLGKLHGVHWLVCSLMYGWPASG
jgi:site-specific recombinase XerD